MTRPRVALVVASLALALAVAEFALRHIGGLVQDEFMRLDPIRGWALRPGFEGWMSAERPLWMRINSDGMRDVERSRARTPNTLRIAVLGDSYMQGVNVPLEETFPSYLEARVSQCLAAPASRVEVLNFGVSGYGTAQELLAYRHQAASYAPDLVLLAMYTRNDIANNHPELNPTEVPELAPYFILRDGELVEDRSFLRHQAETGRQPWWRRARIAITARIRIAQLLYQTWARIRPRVAPMADNSESESDPDDALISLDPEEGFHREPAFPELEAAWQVTEALLRQLAREVAANGSRFWMTTLANAQQVTPVLEERRALERELGVDDLYYPERRLRALAVAEGIPIVTLAEPMADYAASHGVYLNGGYTASFPGGTGHWNARGNQLAADLVGERICAEMPTLVGRARPRVPAGSPHP